jgi:DNA helicase II / ATP-dependent DNA helicase PcrA
MSVFELQGSGPSAPRRRVDYSRELNQEQLDVVLHGDGPCLVLAGAGSGKTRTLTYRVAYLLEQGVDPSSILLLTFTNKASREMLMRVEGLLGGAAKGMWGGTFHSIAFRIIRPLSKAVGYEENVSILDADDARDLIKSVMKDRKIDPKQKRFPSASVVNDVVSFARNVQCSIADAIEAKYPNFQEFAGEIEAIAAEYHERKKQASVMDFDDLLTTLALVLEDPNLGPAVAARFHYILVDEYQDTNALQARIVRGFASAQGNVLVVGDDAQSIYAFRGADVRNILRFPEEWPGAKMFKLLTNYRSTPEILELANESLSHNVQQFQKDLVGLREGGEKPKLVACASASQEAQYVAEQILALRAQGLGLHQVAVLFRSSAHSQALEFELTKRDIPYEYRGGQRFFDRAHIKDVLAFLRIYHNPKDEIAWLRVLGMQTGIGAATASSLARTMGGRGSFSEIVSHDLSGNVSPRARTGIEEFGNIGRAMVSVGHWPASLIRAVSSSSYRDYLEREYPNWRDRLEDVEQLALFAESYEELPLFLSEIALYEDVAAKREAPGGAAEERIVLSTIHQAKGLEWDTVFVIHLCDNAFPNRRAMTEEGGMEEERRLFYVAVTRAKRQLFLVYPLTAGYDALMFQQPSTFIEEVNPRLFERVEIRQARPGLVRGGSSWGQTGSDEWEEGAWEEPTLDVDGSGERSAGTTSSHTQWKPSSSEKKPKNPRSFLRGLDEL